jgi:hypothetical protein
MTLTKARLYSHGEELTLTRMYSFNQVQEWTMSKMCFY